MSDKSPIEEYLINENRERENLLSKELFKADGDNVDIKTELTDKEIVFINILLFNNMILKEKGLKPIYNKFLNQYMRLKISRLRQSRREFVEINKTSTSDEQIKSLNSNIDNILKTKK